MARPIALAVLRLITNSNLVGCCTGESGDLRAASCATLARTGYHIAVGYVQNRVGADRVARTVEGLARPRGPPSPLDRPGPRLDRTASP